MFEHPGRPGDLLPLRSIQVPNPHGKIIGISGDESFYEAQLEVSAWDLTWCD